MIFVLYFQKIIGQRIKIELKNGLKISGMLCSVDAFLNLKLQDIEIENIEDHPGLCDISLLSIRGSSIKLVRSRKDDDLVESLLDATRNRFIINEQREKEEKESLTSIEE
ncbi:U6 snRNA-associated ribonucleoprotein [Pseudoloma neurophilia]|uniref:U6 snRNA-associated ribonucleoprotein n=1 Tax=Pseudoloma neurophilia TaxID=146866 RepID=A0A0R0M4C4_9MICR|nr:U6 snRNA-associated ribonucleoprotein [Pseudoloma neurophilia]